MTQYDGLKVLIVDDERDYCEATGKMLRWYGFDVYLAHGAAEAFHQLEKVVPQLILLDVMMPEIDGLSILRQLAPKPEWLGTRIVMVSAKSAPEDRSAAWMSGADAYLAKPFTADELLSAIDHALAIEASEIPSDGARSGSPSPLPG